MVCLIVGIYSLIGLFLIGAFPMDDIGKTNLGHALGAIIYWSGSVSYWGILTYIVHKSIKFKKIGKIVVELSFLSWSIFLSSFIISIFILPFNNSFPVVFQWNAHLFTLFAILILAIKLVND